jgi:hypothetical protein
MAKTAPGGREVHAAADNADTRNPALAALVTAWHVAAVIAGMIGYHDLALSAGRRELDAATRLGDPVALGLARFGWAGAWNNIGARYQAHTANGLALAELAAVADPSAADTGAAELLGMHHLLAAKLAARTGRAGAADDHLDEARRLAGRTGERNTAQLHFGPTNVALWTMSVGADLGEGPRDYERVHHDPLDVECLNSRERTGSYHFDSARALAQHGGDRDDEAIRHLDLADQAAPVRMRNHPIVPGADRGADPTGPPAPARSGQPAGLYRRRRCGWWSRREPIGRRAGTRSSPRSIADHYSDSTPPVRR